MGREIVSQDQKVREVNFTVSIEVPGKTDHKSGVVESGALEFVMASGNREAIILECAVDPIRHDIGDVDFPGSERIGLGVFHDDEPIVFKLRVR